MARNGYWPRARAERAEQQRRMPPITLARLEALMARDALAEPPDARAEMAHAAADLADLAAAVDCLPERERIAVVLRFWQRAPEAEIALVLGCTERTVRNLLRRAYARLRISYTKGDAIP
jgi:RNA polymerase sigma factor (sigma-70 family)